MPVKIVWIPVTQANNNKLKTLQRLIDAVTLKVFRIMCELIHFFYSVYL